MRANLPAWKIPARLMKKHHVAICEQLEPTPQRIVPEPGGGTCYPGTWLTRLLKATHNDLVASAGKTTKPHCYTTSAR